jgi:hypothetical protein
MVDKPKCAECGAELKWGGFAHNQDTCWDCFKEQFLKICYRHTIDKKERDLLYYLMCVAAEQYGYEF